jgi:hypothetical protein
MKRIYVSTLVSAAAGIAAAGLIAGCSSGSGSSTAAGAGAAGASNGANSAYVSCLSQHGVKLPSGAAGFGGRRSRPAGSGFTPGAGRSGGAGGFGGFASADPTTSAAMQACASLRPTGGAGFGGGFGGSSRLTAFRNCMTQQGEAVPTTRPTAVATPRPTGNARYLNGLNLSDPKVAAALKVCEPLIPTTSASAVPGATATSTT